MKVTIDLKKVPLVSLVSPAEMVIPVIEVYQASPDSQEKMDDHVVSVHQGQKVLLAKMARTVLLVNPDDLVLVDALVNEASLDHKEKMVNPDSLEWRVHQDELDHVVTEVKKVKLSLSKPKVIKANLVKMANKVSQARMVDQVMMVFQESRVQWVTKENQGNKDHLAMMDQEDQRVNEVYQDYPDLTAKVLKVKLDRKVKKARLVNPVKMAEKAQKVNRQGSISEMLSDLLVQEVP